MPEKVANFVLKLLVLANFAKITKTVELGEAEFVSHLRGNLFE
jgi:hypothetical protein